MFSICCTCFSNFYCTVIGLRLLCQPIINKELLINIIIEVTAVCGGETFLPSTIATFETAG
jgi:hypothetical protein